VLDTADVYQSVPADRWWARSARPGPFFRPVVRHIQLGVEGVRAHIPQSTVPRHAQTVVLDRVLQTKKSRGTGATTTRHGRSLPLS